MEYSLKEVVFKTMFIVTVLEILLLQSRSVLRSTERVPGSQRIKFSVKNKKKGCLTTLGGFEWFLIFLILFKSFSTKKIEKLDF